MLDFKTIAGSKSSAVTARKMTDIKAADQKLIRLPVQFLAYTQDVEVFKAGTEAAVNEILNKNGVGNSCPLYAQKGQSLPLTAIEIARSNNGHSPYFIAENDFHIVLITFKKAELHDLAEKLKGRAEIYSEATLRFLKGRLPECIDKFIKAGEIDILKDLVPVLAAGSQVSVTDDKKSPGVRYSPVRSDDFIKYYEAQNIYMVFGWEMLALCRGKENIDLLKKYLERIDPDHLLQLYMLPEKKLQIGLAHVKDQASRKIDSGSAYANRIIPKLVPIISSVCDGQNTSREVLRSVVTALVRKHMQKPYNSPGLILKLFCRRYEEYPRKAVRAMNCLVLVLAFAAYDDEASCLEISRHWDINNNEITQEMVRFWGINSVLQSLKRRSISMGEIPLPVEDKNNNSYKYNTVAGIGNTLIKMCDHFILMVLDLNILKQEDGLSSVFKIIEERHVKEDLQNRAIFNKLKKLIEQYY
ncbi:MAG: hypothetical protein ABIH39_02420 [Candidatus Margulisiibacteriota bacterium]